MRRSPSPKWMSIPVIAAVTMLAACLLLLVLLYVAWGQSGFSDKVMMMHSGGGSKPVAMAIQGAAVRGVGPRNKKMVSSNIRSKHGRNKKKQNRLAIVLPFAGDGPESIPPSLSAVSNLLVFSSTAKRPSTRGLLCQPVPRIRLAWSLLAFPPNIVA
jgi:hypothetical protein